MLDLNHWFDHVSRRNKIQNIELLRGLSCFSSCRFQIIHRLYNINQMSDAALNQFIICIVPLKDVTLPSSHLQQTQSRTETENLKNKIKQSSIETGEDN